jgi:NAD(P)-dependent dehydrogenase (short-subunit alcohol dehydrogenase family)
MSRRCFEGDDMTQLLDGKTAIVSGIGPGMGRDISMRLAEHGADLVLGARTLEKCELVAKEVRELGRRAEVVRLDITDQTSCDHAVRAAVDAFGHLDILVNNAFADGNHRTFLDSSLDDWKATVDVNLWGTLQMTRAAIEPMKEQGDGRVVMVNTMSAHRIRERFGAYAVSKAALENATKTLAIELGRFGIRVNGIHPGYIWGDSVRMYFDYKAQQRGVDPEQVYREVADETALKYLPDSAEISGSVLFFASDLSKPVTGQSLGVNAGHWV